MSEPIKVGDLVVVVKPSACHGGVRDIGHTFVASEVYRAPEMSRCDYCKVHHGPSELVAWDGAFEWPLRRLKRIPPFPELKDEKRDEEITA